MEPFTQTVLGVELRFEEPDVDAHWNNDTCYFAVKKTADYKLTTWGKGISVVDPKTKGPKQVFYANIVLYDDFSDMNKTLRRVGVGETPQLALVAAEQCAPTRCNTVDDNMLYGMRFFDELPLYEEDRKGE